jgi:CDP-diacylglycerol pyrophosphatase
VVAGAVLWKDLQSNPSCRVYDAKDEYVIVKDHDSSKPQGYLLIPSVRISGIEDPRVTSQPFVDLWEDGWSRSYSYPAKPASKTALAINSEVQRTEN